MKHKKTFTEHHIKAVQEKETPIGVIEDFDSFVREAAMLPSLRPRRFNVSNPLEMYFMEVADKHGVIDEILNNEEF